MAGRRRRPQPDKKAQVLRRSGIRRDCCSPRPGTAATLRSKWSKAEERAEIIETLQERGISFDELAKAANQPDADPFDLLCHVAFNAPLRTRRERAENLRKSKRDFFDQYAPEARAVL